MDTSVRVLVVEDSDGETARSLELVDSSIFASTVSDNDGLSRYLSANNSIDCIVCDHALPEIDAIAALKRVRKNHPDLPFVLFTADGSEELASRAITAGVSEYISRPASVTAEDGENDQENYRDLVIRILELVAAERADRARPTSEGISWMLDIDLHRLAGANFIGICLIQNRSLVYVNEELASMFGYTREEMLDTSLSDIIHEDDYERVITNLQKREWNVIDELQYTFRGRRKDGGLVRVEVTGERIVESDPPTVLGMLIDVTNRKRRKEELERYEQMVNAAGDIVYALDSNGRVTFVNDTASCMTGYSRTEIIGQHVSFLINDDEIKEGRNRIQELLNDDSNEPNHDAYEITVNTADGTIIPCQTNITPLTDNATNDNETFNGTVGVIRDITDEKELREKLETERDQLSALFQNVSEPTIQYIMENGVPRVKAVNPAFEETFGYLAESVVDESLDSFIIPIGEEKEAEALNERVIDGEQIDNEVYRQTTHGLRHFRLTNAPISTEGDTIEGYAIYTDITERKRHEDELERQNERLDEFASVVSHDLKQPLGIIYGRLSMIKDEYDSPHLDEIDDALERMETLIENVLTLARQGKIVSTPTPTSLENIVREAWGIAGNDTATLVIDGPLAEIKADSQRLQELFENLFRNAIEHAGNEVTVTVGMRDGNGFYIEDDGPGIPPESRNRVFEHSYSTGDNGTGIGLAIGQAIVEAHGWQITATDGTEGGARFEIRGLNHIVIGGG